MSRETTEKRRKTKEEYYQWVKENDNYPEHTHLYVANLYAGDLMSLFRTFGPFSTAEEARSWAKNYKAKYTKPGFIKSLKVVPMCSVIEPDQEPDPERQGSSLSGLY